MPDPTVRARHVGYTAAGVPVARRMYNTRCLDDPPEFPGVRQVGYTASGLPVKAWAWECCDAFCTDAEEAADQCRVRTDCVPTGIPRRLMAYMTEVQNCPNARNKKTVLEYQDGDPLSPLYQTWYGEIEMRGGTAQLVFTCAAGPSFSLNIGGCQSSAGPAAVTVGCTDPLSVDFNQFLLDDCCDCQLESTGNPLARNADTDIPAEVNVTVVGGCRKTVFARHVGYLPGGTPVVAREVPCPWQTRDETESCNDMRCGLYYSITPVSGCECMEMAEDYLNYRGTQWIDDGGGWGCPGGVRTVAVSCEDLESGQLRLTVNIVCGVTASGSGFVDIDPADLQDLDVDVLVGLGDPDPESGECCTGTVLVRLWRPQ